MQRQPLTVRAALAVLGLAAGADRDEVTQAYRRLARITHPDRSDAPDAASRFGTLTAAYHRALDAAPAPQPTEQTAAPVTPRTAPSPPRVGVTVVVRVGVRPAVGLGVRITEAGSDRPVIIVGPGRVDPLPRRRRTER